MFKIYILPFFFLSNVSNVFFFSASKVFLFEGIVTHHLDNYLEVFFFLMTLFSQSVYGRPWKSYLYGNTYLLAVCEIPKIELTDFEKIVQQRVLSVSIF